jgi:hypothetical protein
MKVGERGETQNEMHQVQLKNIYNYYTHNISNDRLKAFKKRKNKPNSI